jgi:putative toxin-antitoxin system antitoxin component (TIGR02293 family)
MASSKNSSAVAAVVGAAKIRPAKEALPARAGLKSQDSARNQPRAEHEAQVEEAAKLKQVAELLGGSRVLHHRLNSALDAHEMLARGLPGKALKALIGNVTVEKSGAFEKAIGMSLRTVQRHKDAPSTYLSGEQSGRIWKFAEIIAKAAAVLGSKEEAEKWLNRPATGLNQRRPIDLLATPAGARLVEDFLQRLEYGVYG